MAHWNNSLQVNMSLHSDTLSWFHANQSLLLISCQPVFALGFMPTSLCSYPWMLCAKRRSNKYQFSSLRFEHQDLVNCYGISVSNRYVPLVVRTFWSFPHSWIITGFVTRVTWQVPLLELELLTLPEHLIWPPVFNGVRVLLDH
jgi:hypothetical protein